MVFSCVAFRNKRAPGFRDAGYFNAPGRLSGVGYGGFSWSSATGGIYGLDLNFSSQRLYTSYSDSRAYGLQLRCLSE